MKLPGDHPQRRELNDEVHARPPDPMVAPLRLSYLALRSDGDRAAEWSRVAELAKAYGLPPPPATANHYSAVLGGFRLKCERHTEFTRYTFVVEGAGTDPFADTALEAVPPDWLASLPGEVMVAVHAALLPTPPGPMDFDAIAARHFAGNTLIGSSVGGGAATALTDFRIQPDGFTRLLVHDRAMTPRQAGRMMQRLLEIETYRVMALLALPSARNLAPLLSKFETELAAITTSLVDAKEADEPVLLDRLTRLAADMESREAASHYRFAASAAYYGLVRRRTEELRETRLHGLQTFGEFTERRLAPAMATCESVSNRQATLAQRMARATQLLSTRVDLTRERQNHALLGSMDRRAQMQFRLQSTVEGLSIAAITYYVVGLVGYAARGIKSLGVPVGTDAAMAISIPIVALFAAWGVHRIRKVVFRES